MFFLLIYHAQATINTVMNYLIYVLAAYTFTFVIITVMFTSSYRRYKQAKADFNDVKTQTPQ